MENLKEKIIQILNKYITDDYLLFAFGSYTKGKIVKSSDLDLAVYKNKQIPSYIIIQAKEELEEKAGTLRDIDLINLTDENISIELLKNILKEGVIWKKTKNSKELLKSLKRRLVNLEK